MPLDPWIIEEILRREREKREEQERRQQPTLEIEEPREEKPGNDDSEKPGHELPADRKHKHEISDPKESPRPSEEKKDDEDRNRGVDISRITGSDDDDEDGGSIVIDIFPERKLPKEEPAKKTPEKKPD